MIGSRLHRDAFHVHIANRDLVNWDPARVPVDGPGTLVLVAQITWPAVAFRPMVRPSLQPSAPPSDTVREFACTWRVEQRRGVVGQRLASRPLCASVWSLLAPTIAVAGRILCGESAPFNRLQGPIQVCNASAPDPAARSESGSSRTASAPLPPA
jgi:hypothetical protein